MRNTGEVFLTVFLRVFCFINFPRTTTLKYFASYITEKTNFSFLFFEYHITHIDLSLTFAYIGFYFTDSSLGVAEHEKLPTGTCYISKSSCGVWG